MKNPERHEPQGHTPLERQLMDENSRLKDKIDGLEVALAAAVAICFGIAVYSVFLA